MDVSLESVENRMDPLDVLCLREYERGGEAAASVALGILTLVGMRYRLEKAEEMLAYMRTEPSPRQDALEELSRDWQVRGWSASKKEILSTWLNGCLATYHICRALGHKTSEGVYVRSVIRSHPDFRARLSDRTLAWIAWRLAMPMRYQGSASVRGAANPATLTASKCRELLAGTDGMVAQQAARLKGVTGETLRKWRGRAAGLPGM